MQTAIQKPSDVTGTNFQTIYEALFGKKNLLKIKSGLDQRRTDYETAYGLTPPDEYIYLSLLLENPKELEEGEEWYLRNELINPSKLQKDKDLKQQFGNYNFLMTLFTGTERFGSDGGGDACLVSLRGNDGSSPVFNYNHEVGELDGIMAGSITSFFADIFGLGPEYDDEDEDEEEDEGLDKETKERLRRIIYKFDNELRKKWETIPAHRNPEQLFNRSHWILQHTTGDPTFNFAAHMSAAPIYNTWETELPLLAEEPQLANYWLLHHFFLGNGAALQQTVEAVASSASAVTRFLAQSVLKAHSGGKGLFKLSKDQTNRLISDTRKNAKPELLEPEERKKMAAERGEDKILKLSNDAFLAIEDDATALWAAIESYPDDVAGHDRILQKIAELDESISENIEDYFDARSDDADDDWPRERKRKKGATVDARLSFPISVAFMAGLTFSDDNENANAGLTQTLGFFDDDYAMAGYERAIEQLNPKDDRAEYVFKCLAESKHARAPELMNKAAWRFFDIANEAIRQEKELQNKRQKDGVDLNNMWGVSNHFQIPLRHCLERMDEASEKLAREIFSEIEKIQAFKSNLGRAMAVLGERGISDFNDTLVKYIEWVQKRKSDYSTKLDEVGSLNLSEASIALARLDPEKARNIIPVLFERTTENPYFDLDIKAALLGGMFILEPEGPELAGWLKRLLGNRDNNERLIGALRAATVANLPESFPWVRHHLYSDTNSFMSYHELIKEMALAAVAALGYTDLPAYEDRDKFGMGLKDDKLAEALGTPEIYEVKDVLKKIHKKGIAGPEVAAAVRDFLADVLRYSSDENNGTFDAYWSGYKAIAVQGPDARPLLMELLDLEFCEPGLINNIILIMRLLEGEADFTGWLLDEPLENLLEYLMTPEPRTIGYLELVAARAYLLDSEKTKPALENCLKWRLRFAGGSFADEEPSIIGLLKVYALYGNQAKALIRELSEQNASSKLYGMDDLREKLTKAMDAAKIPAGAGKSSQVLEAPLKLFRYMRDKDWGAGQKFINLTRTKKAITFKHVAMELAVSGAFTPDDRESQIKKTFETPEQADQCLQDILDICFLLGYQVVPVKKKKAKKK